MRIFIKKLLVFIIILPSIISIGLAYSEVTPSTPAYSTIIDEDNTLTIFPYINSYSDLNGSYSLFRGGSYKIADAHCYKGYISITFASEGEMKPISPPLISKVKSDRPIPLCPTKDH